MKTDMTAFGLSSEEASRRLVQDGPNVTEEGKKASFVKMFAAQFCDLMIVILLVAAALSLVIAIVSGDVGDILEPIIIVAIVLANATLGALQEFRAEKSLQELKKLTSPRTKVVRDGKLCVIGGADVVCGDCAVFDAGDVVTADVKLLFAESLQVNQSALTGESVPVEKSAYTLQTMAVSDDAHTVYAGSFVTKGRCFGIVHRTGKNTEIGKVAALITGRETPLTPLQQKLKHLGKVIGIVCLAVCAVVFVTAFVKGVNRMGDGDTLLSVFVDIFLTSVSLAVAAIPEGLPAVVTVVLAKGIESMARKNAVVKRLTSVESLGSATVICSDKTGTLTQNKMTLYGVFDGRKFVSGCNIAEVAPLVERFADCCDVTTDGDGNTVGDPTEIAVTVHATAAKKSTRMFELPFDSNRKLMTVVVRDGGEYFVVTKGSPEAMNTSANYALFERQSAVYARRGFRVLALSVKKVGADFPRSARLESDFNIVGLFVIADPPRKEALNAVKTCKAAGIKPVMITGDSLATATEIASSLGIKDENDRAVDGVYLDKIDDETLAKEVPDIAVYARVTPADKLRIVEAWQKNGAVVAMTGDGVNDAPALKRADIGCAMGSGTEVAKNAADMILADDNFATVVDAVSLGRSVYENIKKSVMYLVTCNVGEVLCVLFALLLWDVSPLSAMQLLWVNLVTDGLPGLALGIYKQENDVMSRTPRSATENFFSHGGGMRIIVGGVLFGLVTLVGYAVGNTFGAGEASTVAFLVLSMSQLFFALEMRSRRGLFDRDITPFMAWTTVLSFALVGVVSFVPPLMSLFGLSLLPVWMYVVSVFLAVAPSLAYAAARALNLHGKFTLRTVRKQKLTDRT